LLSLALNLVPGLVPGRRTAGYCVSSIAAASQRRRSRRVPNVLQRSPRAVEETVAHGFDHVGPEWARAYDAIYAAQSEPSVLDPMVDVLADLAQRGSALEFAVGTGRVALALSARGIPVQGIELSPHMVREMRAKPGADTVPVTTGDMTSTRVAGHFQVVYLVANTIMNVTTQDEQLAVFANAAAHLDTGGCFVVEVIVPQVRSVPRGEIGRGFTLAAEHVGIETFDDTVAQVAWSHHWTEVGGRLVRHSAPYRYIWPSELDLMARLAGLRLRHRWDGWDRGIFTSESQSQVAGVRARAMSRSSSPARRVHPATGEESDLVPRLVPRTGSPPSLRAPSGSSSRAPSARRRRAVGPRPGPCGSARLGSRRIKCLGSSKRYLFNRAAELDG
jgi:SAM-dependent methyltransferase